VAGRVGRPRSVPARDGRREAIAGRQRLGGQADVLCRQAAGRERECRGRDEAEQGDCGDANGSG
jgi:hypothetical protein